MVAVWHACDWPLVGELFASDGVLHSMMVEPVVGRAAIATRIRHLGKGIDRISLDTRHIGVIDGVVFMERVDRFFHNGNNGAVPVVGVLEIRAGLVQVWREYCDRSRLLRETDLQEGFANSIALAAPG